MKDFSRVYREAAADIVPFLTPERLEVIGRHNPGWSRIVADWPRKRFAGMREVLLACASRG